MLVSDSYNNYQLEELSKKRLNESPDYVKDKTKKPLSLRQVMVPEHLDEVLLGKTKSDFHIKSNQQSNIYMNPPSIKRFPSDLRAISDKDGNLYIEDGNIIHCDIMDFLIRNNYIDHKYPSPKKYYGYEDFANVEVVGWERFKNTNKFLLGESYDKLEKEYLLNYHFYLIKAVVAKHPQLKFYTKQIDYEYDHENINDFKPVEI